MKRIVLFFTAIILTLTILGCRKVSENTSPLHSYTMSNRFVPVSMNLPEDCTLIPSVCSGG